MKQLIQSILASSLLISLCGCGPTPPVVPPPDPVPPPGPKVIKLTLKEIWGKKTADGSQPYAAVVKRVLIDRPGATINVGIKVLDYQKELNIWSGKLELTGTITNPFTVAVEADYTDKVGNIPAPVSVERFPFRLPFEEKTELKRSEGVEIGIKLPNQANVEKGISYRFVYEVEVK